MTRAASRALAATLAGLTLLAAGLVHPTPARAAPGDASSAAARFLSGTLAADGLSLDEVVALHGAASSNDGTRPDVESDAGLSLTALGGATVSVPQLPTLPFGQLLDVGLVRQWTQSQQEGRSRSAVGAVDGTGRLLRSGGPDRPGSATFDLSGLLGPRLGGAVADVRLELEELAAVAAIDSGAHEWADTCVDLDAPTNCRDYSIGNGALVVRLPAVAALTTTVGTAVQTASSSVAGLTGPSGALSRALAGLHPALSGLVGNPGVTATVAVDLPAAVQPLLTTPLGTGGPVVVDVPAGIVRVDLDALLRADPDSDSDGLEDLRPSTELLSQPLLDEVAVRVDALLTQLQTRLAVAVDAALRSAQVVVRADLQLVPPPLRTAVDVAVAGTVEQVLAGPSGGSQARITLVVAGLPVTVSVGSLLSALSAPLRATLLAPGTGATAGFGSGTAALVTLADDVVSPALRLLPRVVSLLANVQEQPRAGVYRQTALRLSVGDLMPARARAALRAAGTEPVLRTAALASTAAAADTPVAVTVDLARAEVGPNLDVASTEPTTALAPETGSTLGGQTVEVTGGPFHPSARVTVDGTTLPASQVTWVSSSRLRYLAPAHGPTSVPVTVTNPESPPSAPATYAYVRPVPRVDALDPASGPTEGGGTVTVSGGDFLDGATVQVDGRTLAPSEVTVVSPTELQYVAPAHAAGPVGVTVTNPGTSPSATLLHTYVAPRERPAVTSLAPASGPDTGGQTVTLTGSGFSPDDEVLLDGQALPAGRVTVVAATRIDLVVPPHAAGPVAVTVRTADGQQSDPATYVVTRTPSRTVTAEPASGPPAGGYPVVLTGECLTGTSVSVDGAALPSSAYTVVSDTRLEITMPAGRPGGSARIDVLGGACGAHEPVTFTYGAPTAAWLVAVSPDAGPTTGGDVARLTGTGLAPDVVVEVDGVPVDPADTTWLDSGTVLVTMPGHTAGDVSLAAVNPGAATSNRLTYRYLPPTVDPAGPIQLDPSSGPPAGGTRVQVTGACFTGDGLGVTVDGTPVSATVLSATTLEVVSMPAGHPGTTVDVQVTGTACGTTHPATFTYDAVPTPVLSGIAPAAGPELGGQAVTLTGSGFLPGTRVRLDAHEVDPASVSFVSPTELRFATPVHGPGVVAVTVTTPGSLASAPLDYEYRPVDRTVVLTPASGAAGGGGEVVVRADCLTGSSSAVTVRVNGQQLPRTAFRVDAHAQLTVLAMPPGAPGTSVPVQLAGTACGDTEPAPYAYRLDAAPSVDRLDPASGPVSGGDSVTVTGSGFRAGAVVEVGGSPVPFADVTVVDATTLVLRTPAHSAGPVPVVVRNPGSETSSPTTYTYTASPPAVLVALDPSAGPAAGGQLVTVRGRDLLPGATVRLDGEPVPAGQVAIGPDGDSLVFSTPRHEAGPVGVTVVNTVGRASAPLTYRYLPPPPAALTASPASGPAAGGGEVVLTGACFTGPGLAVLVDGRPLPSTAFRVDSDRRTTVLAMPAGTAATTVDLQVVGTSCGVTEPTPYRYEPAPPAARPVVARMDPARGPLTGGYALRIFGHGFPAHAVVQLDRVPVPTEVAADGTVLRVVVPATTWPHVVDVAVVAGASRLDVGPHEYVADVRPADPVAGPAPADPGAAPNPGSPSPAPAPESPSPAPAPESPSPAPAPETPGSPVPGPADPGPADPGPARAGGPGPVDGALGGNGQDGARPGSDESPAGRAEARGRLPRTGTPLLPLAATGVALLVTGTLLLPRRCAPLRRRAG